MGIHKRGLIKYFWHLLTGVDEFFAASNWLAHQHRRIEVEVTKPPLMSESVEITGNVAVEGLKKIKIWFNPQLEVQVEAVDAEIQPSRIRVGKKPDSFFPIRLTRVEIEFTRSLPKETRVSILMRASGELRPGWLSRELPWGITMETMLLKDESLWCPFMGESAFHQFIFHPYAFELETTLPDTWRLAATGIPNSTEEGRFHSSTAMVNGISLIGDQFEDDWYQDSLGDLKFWLRWPKQKNTELHLSKDQVMEILKDVGSELMAIWGEPLLKDVVTCITKTNFGNFCSGNFVTLDHSAGSDQEKLFGSLAHEMPHLWWGGTFQMPNDARMLWIIEGMPEYMDLYLERKRYGDEKASGSLESLKKYYKPKPLRKLRPIFDIRDNTASRINPVIAFHELEQRLGPSAFYDLLKDIGAYFREHPVTWDGFVQVFMKSGYHDNPEKLLEECGF